MKDQRSEDSRINISVKNGNLSKKKPDSKNPEKQHPVVLHEINDMHAIILLRFMYLYYLYHVFTVNIRVCPRLLMPPHEGSYFNDIGIDSL